MPTVLPASSLPMKAFFSHWPARVEASAGTMKRMSASSRAITSSATALALAPGVFITSTPRLRACLVSIVSKPAPARTITLSPGSRSITAAVTGSLRTISA